jgi:hypothetical protein
MFIQNSPHSTVILTVGRGIVTVKMVLNPWFGLEKDALKDGSPDRAI